MTQRSPLLIASIVAESHWMFAVIGEPGFASEDIADDDGPAHPFAQFHLRLIFPELTTAHQERSTLCLQRVAPFLFLIPLHECAIAEPNRPAPRNFGDLVAWPPKGAIDKPH